MKYFRVNIGSEYFCGYDCQGYFKAENEQDIYEQPEYLGFRDEMIDYVTCSIDESDYEENEDADALSEMTDEITKAEYLQGISFYSEAHPYQVG